MPGIKGVPQTHYGVPWWSPTSKKLWPFFVNNTSLYIIVSVKLDGPQMALTMDGEINSTDRVVAILGPVLFGL